ncbi:MAG TPA: 1-deoxy-D-xylulose-5-phosphate reductoisomerase, partial [Lachnospiraceae bacterium]|nr:1-deoxy-D-xylulose-5-phosphate reductoisomerase [Lachnospiraceae bacterium]
ITFEEPDLETFRGLKLAFEAGRLGGSIPTVYNAANELAVSMFLKRKISYLEIVKSIEYAMKKHSFIDNPNVEQILSVEQETYHNLEEKWKKEEE